jgi:hypothetical protein
MITVEEIDQIAAGIRDAIGAQAAPKKLNHARRLLSCILARLAETDLEVLERAQLAAVGRLRTHAPADTQLSKIATDECDPLHTEFLLLAPSHVLKKYAHERTHHSASSMMVGPISAGDLPPELRAALKEMAERIMRKNQDESADNDE